MDASGRIILFGATGYTGELTARAMAAQGARPLLAARREEPLAALAEELGGLAHAVADVERPGSIADLLEPGDILVTTVGPFARHGEAALDAALGSGAHYVDSTGEPGFIRHVFESDGRAAAAGSILLTALGYDWVPGNLAGALALREAGSEATGVRIGYFITGAISQSAMSGGTRVSSAGAALDPQYGYRHGALVSERPGKRIHEFEIDGKQMLGLSVGSSESLSLPRVHPGLRDVEVYLGWFGKATRRMHQGSAVLSALTRIPGSRPLLERVTLSGAQGSSGGPDAEARANSGSLIVAEALGAGGETLATVELRGRNAYDFTAGFLAWSASRLAAGIHCRPGALGPVEAFGLEQLEAGVAEAGIART